MEHDIIFYHKELQKRIHLVEKDETDRDALNAVKETFLSVFEMIKAVMISKQERYYGIFLMNFDLRVDFTSYHEASVSIDFFPFRMTVNPLLIGLRSLPEMIYVLCHEIEHIVLNHPADGIRYNPRKDPQVGSKLNIAMDASINDRLSADIGTNRYQVISEPEDVITSAFLHDFFGVRVRELQAFDYYFERIPDPSDNGNFPPTIVVITGSAQEEIITAPKRKGLMCLPCWTVRDDPDEIDSIIRRFVSDVCDGMPDSMRSNLPAYQTEALNRLLSPPSVSWKALLKRYIGTIPHGHRKTRTRLSRRQPERYDISGTVSDRIVKLIVAIDTSGSMSAETLERIMAEIFAIIGTRMCEVTVLECDAEIQRIYRAHSVKDILYDIRGRGGTSFIPVIEYINRNRQYRDAILIYFTDGMGDRSVPRPLTRKMMWILHNENCRLSVSEPYGEILVLD